MPRTRIIGIAFTIILLSATGLAQDLSPDQILERVKGTYASLETYKAEGTITTDMNTGGMAMKMTTSFSIRLKKPNLYLISWTQDMGMPGMSQSGAVWSDGTQPYLYMMNAYSKMASDEIALASATGISGGVAFTIPSLFLPTLQSEGGSFLRMRVPKIEATEKIGEEDCFVISGASEGSKKETFWISKSRFLILKYARSLEPPEGGRQVPELTDDQLEEAIKGVGQKVTPESKKKMKDLMDLTKGMAAQVPLTGWSTELHTGISSPGLSMQDMRFNLPDGAILKDSLFDGIFGGAKR